MNDLLRMSCIQVVMQFLYWAVDDTNTVPLVGTDFLLLLMFMLVGVAMYHLVLQRVLYVR
jgi:hypothetical protein